MPKSLTVVVEESGEVVDIDAFTEAYARALLAEVCETRAERAA